MKNIGSYCAGVALALCLGLATAAAADGEVRIRLPEEVEEGLEKVGIHVERDSGMSDGTKQALIIGGGVVVAGAVIAYALRRNKAV